MKEAISELATMRLHECVVHYAQCHLEGQDNVNLYAKIIGEVEAPLIQAAMQATQGNQAKAARLLGISRNTLLKRLAQFASR